jgi:thiol-disulfide isomerase/thioredoxin
MKKFFPVLAGALLFAVRSFAGPLPIEQQVAEAVKSSHVTVVHFWAPWCPNCKAELADNAWSNFVTANPDVNFIFVTVWRGELGDGRALLEKNGLGGQKNFSLLVHPNASLKAEDKMRDFMGLPLTWIPSTWVFREGNLRYALNYGELRFPMLQQLIHDSQDKWDR